MARKIYSQKFKKVEIKRVIGQWHTLSSVATWLGLCCDTLRTDVELAKFGSEKSFALTDFPAEQRFRELEKENARLRMERDIVKKATAYFAKEHLRSSPLSQQSRSHRRRWHVFQLRHEGRGSRRRVPLRRDVLPPHASARRPGLPQPRSVGG